MSQRGQADPHRLGKAGKSNRRVWTAKRHGPVASVRPSSILSLLLSPFLCLLVHSRDPHIPSDGAGAHPRPGRRLDVLDVHKLLREEKNSTTDAWLGTSRAFVQLLTSCEPRRRVHWRSLPVHPRALVGCRKACSPCALDGTVTIACTYVRMDGVERPLFAFICSPDGTLTRGSGQTTGFTPVSALLLSPRSLSLFFFLQYVQ